MVVVTAVVEVGDVVDVVPHVTNPDEDEDEDDNLNPLRHYLGPHPDLLDKPHREGPLEP